jgi:lysophospholipase L1-like esterase
MALVRVNTRPTSWRPARSLLLSLSLAVGAEAAARLTPLNSAWTRSANWSRATEEFRQLLEIRQYRSYPDEGFPVQPPAPDASRRRVVALGGSSTGGAYQMDDLRYFWPKKLEERLAGTDWEVVNQGVGGWNTLHVRLYVESQIERLDADILAIYVGHNDLLYRSPVPYRELYQRYRAGGGGALGAAVDAMNRARLYVGLKYLLLSLRDGGGAIAVPVADARDNLAAIADAAAAHRVKVLWMTEGLNPDPVAMEPYAAMQATLAKEKGAAYLDAAGLLFASGDPELFLDDCHLSVAGHEFLAMKVEDALRSHGWL